MWFFSRRINLSAAPGAVAYWQSNAICSTTLYLPKSAAARCDTSRLTGMSGIRNPSIGRKAAHRALSNPSAAPWRSASPNRWAMRSSPRERSSMWSRPEHSFKKRRGWTCSGLPMQSGCPYSRCVLDRIKVNCITGLWCDCSMTCSVFRPEAAALAPGPTAIRCLI